MSSSLLSKRSNTKTSVNCVGKGNVLVEGPFHLGTDFDTNYLRPGVLGVGGAFTQGQVVQSWYEVNNSRPFLYGPTTFDESTIITTYSNIVDTYPVTGLFPYLTVTQVPTNSVPAGSNTFPIYNYVGKGKSQEIEFYTSGESIEHGEHPENISKDTWDVCLGFYFCNIFRDQVQVPKPMMGLGNGGGYPYSGLLYSGNLCQYSFTTDTVRVMPYQIGRGIPQIDPTKQYYSGNSYGSLVIPGTEIPIEPQLACGVTPGNNNICIGVALDTNIKTNYTSKMYKYREPEGYSSESMELYGYTPYDAHPAPFTASPRNANIFRYNAMVQKKSPPNSVGTGYAPWPNYYAYQPGDSVPILTDGMITCKIGAATNIGIQVYYEPDVVQGENPINNPKYIPVPVIPLFQGEKVLCGSTVFAAAQGHVITHSPVGWTPYPPASAYDATGLVVPFLGSGGRFLTFMGATRDARRENPWYDYFDITFGSTGWTSTPQFRLDSIPDQGIDIIQTRDPNNPQVLPYLNQANQGSIIVQARTIQSPVIITGSARMTLAGPGEYNGHRPYIAPQQFNPKFERISRYPGMAERSLAVGHMMEDIEGQGQWRYTGLYLEFFQTGYVNGVQYNAGTYYETYGGTGNGAVVFVNTVGVLGNVTSVTLANPGSGYTDGDVLTLYDPALFALYADDTIVFQRTACVVYNTAGPSVSLHFGGSRYRTAFYVVGFNVTANDLILECTCTYTRNIGLSAQAQHFDLYTLLADNPVALPVFDSAQYPIGTVVRPLKLTAAYDELARYRVDTNDGLGALTLEYAVTFSGGGLSAYESGNGVTMPYTGPGTSRLYATIKERQRNPIFAIEVDTTTGQVMAIFLVDPGEGNRDGDTIILIQPGSDNNCVFRMNLFIGSVVPVGQKVAGGAGYFFNPIVQTDAKTIRNAGELLPNTVEIYNPGQIDALAEGRIGYATPIAGTVKNLILNPNVESTYTGTFGSIQTIFQVYPFDMPTQPDPLGGAPIPIPSDGWVSQVYRSNATFYQDVDIKIIVGGTGYVIGGPFTTTGGSGAGFTVYVTKVSEEGNGVVESVIVANIGSGYLQEDLLVISGGGNGDCQIVLKVPRSQELDLRVNSALGSVGSGAPYLFFDCKILNGGTGYTVANDLTTTCPTFDVKNGAVNLFVDVLKVDPITGAILDVRITRYNNTVIRWVAYQIGYRIVVNGGNNDSLIELTRPRPAKRMRFTSGGTNYVTATNVNTYNLTENNLVVMCELGQPGPGQVTVASYVPSDPKPPTWDLSRYAFNDEIQFLQPGATTYAQATIDDINRRTELLTFLQTDFGSGYTGTGYVLLPTLNVSETPTTVNIVANANGEVEEVTINQLGSGAQFGDYLVIEQGDYNCVVQLVSTRDVPPQWQLDINSRRPSAAEWNHYKTVLQSGTNLLEKNALINFKKVYPNYYNNSYYTYGDPDNKDPNTSGVSTN